MVLPTTGIIRISMLKQEYGGLLPVNLMRFRGFPGIPSSGVIKFSTFLGKSAYYDITPTYPSTNAKCVLDAVTLSNTDNTLLSTWGVASQSTTSNQPTFRLNLGMKYATFKAGALSSGGSRMTVPSTSMTQAKYGTNGGFTLALLIDFSSISQTSEGMITRINDAGSSLFRTFELFVRTNGTLNAIFFYASSHQVSLSLSQIGTLGEWQFIVFRQNQTTNRLEAWVNNKLIATGATVNAMQDAGTPSVEVNYHVYNGYCNGIKLAFYGYYDRSLTTEEMSTTYSSFSKVIGTTV